MTARQTAKISDAAGENIFFETYLMLESADSKKILTNELSSTLTKFRTALIK